MLLSSLVMALPSIFGGILGYQNQCLIFYTFLQICTASLSQKSVISSRMQSGLFPQSFLVLFRIWLR